MSQRALRLATRKHLHKVFEWDKAVCDIMPDGRPKPWSGELFVAIHQGGFRNAANDRRADTHTVRLTVTRKISFSAWDDAAYEVIDERSEGLDALCDKIVRKIHNNYTLMGYANDFIWQAWLDSGGNSGTTVNGFAEPLRIRDVGEPTLRGPEWFHGGGNTVEGISMTLVFGDAVRQQDNALQF